MLLFNSQLGSLLIRSNLLLSGMDIVFLQVRTRRMRCSILFFAFGKDELQNLVNLDATAVLKKPFIIQ